MSCKALGANGMELENASQTALNLTDISVFNLANVFDAEGLTRLTEQIEDPRKTRNRIENEARIDIKLRDFEAEQLALGLYLAAVVARQDNRFTDDGADLPTHLALIGACGLQASHSMLGLILPWSWCGNGCGWQPALPVPEARARPWPPPAAASPCDWQC